MHGPHRFFRLATAVLVASAFNVYAEDVPLGFESTRSAQAWFSKTYPSHEMMKYAIKAPQGGNESMPSMALEDREQGASMCGSTLASKHPHAICSR